MLIPMGDPRELIDDGAQSLKKGDWDEASRLLEKAIAELEGLEQTDDVKGMLAEALRQRAFADSRIGEVGRAVVQAKRSLEISESIGDVKGEAEGLRRLGYVHWQKGDLLMADQFYAAALEKAMDSGDKDLEGRIRIEVANSLNTRGDLDKAKDEYSKAIELLKGEANMNELARAYNNLGDCHIKRGELEEAITVLRQCMDIGGKIGDLTIKGWAAFNAAECFTRMQETKIAKEYLELAVDILESSDDRVGLAGALRIYGITFTAEREWVMAEDAFNKGYSIATELEMPGLEGELLMSKAEMYIARGEKAVAMDLLERAIKLLREGNRNKEAEVAKALLKRTKAA